MNVEITIQLIVAIQSLKLSIEEYIILLLMKNEEWSILNVLDKNSTDTKCIILYQKLCRDGFIQTTSGTEDNLFELTDKAKQLFNQ